MRKNYDEINYEGIEHIFDLSGYSKDSNKYNNINKGILGTLKDEYSETKINKFICLKSKCYILELESSNGKEGKIVVKNKGVSGSNKFKIEQFEGILTKTIPDIFIEQYTIKSFKHKVNTVKYNKMALKIISFYFDISKFLKKG